MAGGVHYNEEFYPDVLITREEIAAMVIRSVQYLDSQIPDDLMTPEKFKDHGSIGAFTMDSVYKAHALGIVKGDAGEFKPKADATCAEEAAMLHRALDKVDLID